MNDERFADTIHYSLSTIHCPQGSDAHQLAGAVFPGFLEMLVSLRHALPVHKSPSAAPCGRNTLRDDNLWPWRCGNPRLRKCLSRGIRR